MDFSPLRKARLLLLVLVGFSLMALPWEHPVRGSEPTQQGGNPQQPPTWKVYHDPLAPFEFSYPDDFLLDAHANAKFGFIFALMKKQNTPWLIDIDFADRADYATHSQSPMPMAQFAIKIARLGCDADGPEGTVYCPGITSRRIFRNRSGLEVVEFYLKQVYERYDPPKTTESLVGPVEAVLLPTIGSGKVLTFKPTDMARPRLVGKKLLRQIAESVRLAH
ncbi:MAG: hypothetical protein P8Z30_20450 [Acidobacteriota bacterium]